MHLIGYCFSQPVCQKVVLTRSLWWWHFFKKLARLGSSSEVTNSFLKLKNNCPLLNCTHIFPGCASIGQFRSLNLSLLGLHCEWEKMLFESLLVELSGYIFHLCSLNKMETFCLQFQWGIFPSRLSIIGINYFWY